MQELISRQAAIDAIYKKHIGGKDECEAEIWAKQKESDNNDT